jgi:hypothetical protein
MAMQIRWYGAESITQYGRSRATLDATGLRHLGGTFLFSFHFFGPESRAGFLFQQVFR